MIFMPGTSRYTSLPLFLRIWPETVPDPVEILVRTSPILQQSIARIGLSYGVNNLPLIEIYILTLWMAAHPAFMWILVLYLSHKLEIRNQFPKTRLLFGYLILTSVRL